MRKAAIILSITAVLLIVALAVSALNLVAFNAAGDATPAPTAAVPETAEPEATEAPAPGVTASFEEPGNYTGGTQYDHGAIKAENVRLDGFTFTGDVTVYPEAGGVVELNSVTAGGVIRVLAPCEVHLLGCTAGGLIIEGGASVNADARTGLGDVSLTGADSLTLLGSCGDIAMSAGDGAQAENLVIGSMAKTGIVTIDSGAVVQADAYVEKLILTDGAGGSVVRLLSGGGRMETSAKSELTVEGRLTELHIKRGADGTTLALSGLSTVDALAAEAGMIVTGEGSIRAIYTADRSYTLPEPSLMADNIVVAADPEAAMEAGALNAPAAPSDAVTSWYSADKSQYSIATEKELSGFMKLMNDGVDFSGKTVRLTADIALESDSAELAEGARFSGVFDGGGHTVSGMTKALFKNVSGGGSRASIKNITLSTADAGAQTHALLVSGVADRTDITDVTTEGTVLIPAARAQGAGQVFEARDCTFTGCVNNAEVKATPWGCELSLMGGIAARVDGDTKFDSCEGNGALKCAYGTQGVYAGQLYGAALKAASGEARISAVNCTLGKNAAVKVEGAEPIYSEDSFGMAYYDGTAHLSADAKDELYKGLIGRTPTDTEVTYVSGGTEYISPGGGNEKSFFTADRVWDGTKISTSWYAGDLEGTEYYIGYPAQLAGAASLVNDGVTTFSGCTLHIAADMSLGGKIWTPIGCCFNPDNITAKAVQENRMFLGTLAGDGHTISNLYINAPKLDYMGLIGFNNRGVTVTGLMLSGVEINGRNCAGGVVAGYEGDLTGTVTLTDVAVKDAVITGVSRLGGIVGCGAANMTGCAVKDVTVTAEPNSGAGGEYAGGMAGCLGKGSQLTDCRIEDVAVSAFMRAGGAAGAALTAPESADVTAQGSIAISIDKTKKHSDAATRDIVLAGALIGDTEGEFAISGSARRSLSLKTAGGDTLSPALPDIGRATVSDYTE